MPRDLKDATVENVRLRGMHDLIAVELPDETALGIFWLTDISDLWGAAAIGQRATFNRVNGVSGWRRAIQWILDQNFRIWFGHL